MATTTNSVDELFLFYRQKFSRTCFAMLLTVQIIYHVVYIVLRRTLSNQVRFIRFYVDFSEYMGKIRH